MHEAKGGSSGLNSIQTNLQRPALGFLQVPNSPGPGWSLASDGSYEGLQDRASRWPAVQPAIVACWGV